MITRFLSLFFLVSFTVHAEQTGDYSVNVRHVITQLKELESGLGVPRIAGDAVGYAGTPDATYLLFQYIRRFAQDDDLERMMKDENAAVRSMGALCSLYDDWRKIDASKIDALLLDGAPIVVGEGGCMSYQSTVGELVKKLKANPKLFEFDRGASSEETAVSDGGQPLD